MKKYLLIALSAIILASPVVSTSWAGLSENQFLAEKDLWFNALNSNNLPQMSNNFDSSKYDKEIDEIENYLNGIRTLQAKFFQVSAGRGLVSQGKISFEKPGKVRWDYLVPKEVSMVIVGDDVVLHDKALDQTTYVNKPDTPIDTLLEGTTDFRSLATILGFYKDESTYAIAVTGRGKAADYSNQKLVLQFTREARGIELSRITRVDGAGQIINMQLIDTEINPSLSSDTFRFKNRSVRERNRLRRN